LTELSKLFVEERAMHGIEMQKDSNYIHAMIAFIISD